MRPAFAMGMFINDSSEEISTQLPSANISSDDGTTSSFQRGSIVPGLLQFKMSLMVVGVVGILTNGLVFVGFALAGRAKMNSSSFHIAYHTTFEQSTLFHHVIIIIIINHSTSRQKCETNKTNGVE